MRAKKNVTYVRGETLSAEDTKLLGPTGDPVLLFSQVVSTMQQLSYNSRDSYCASIADFIDYLFEAYIVMTIDFDRLGLSRSELSNIVEAWKEYLTFGLYSQNEIARKVANSLPSPMLDSSSVGTKLAGLQYLLRVSELRRREELELNTLGVKKSLVDLHPLKAELHKAVSLSFWQKQKMARQSVAIGNVPTEDITIRAPFFSRRQCAKEFDENQIFPLDRFDDYINHFRSFRDQAFSCFQAASGCRSHEVSQILWEDIDIPNGEVKLISPWSRENHSSYLALTSSERNRLAWKGRETSLTFLIEPFASMFFEKLELYFRNEYIPHGRHNFVFQILRGPTKGKPYFLADPSTKREAFIKAATGVGIYRKRFGSHSLRRAYGTYLLNYIPISDGEYGLPISDVRVMMGHASIKSTERYALKDRQILLSKLEFANLQTLHHRPSESHLMFRIDALKAEISRLEALMRKLDWD